MSRQTIILAAAAAAAIGITSCSSTRKASCETTAEATTANTLTGRWIIKNASGYSTNGAPDEAYIEFDGKGGVNGCTGVNQFFGSYDGKGGLVSIDGMNSSRMGAGPYRETEQAVLRALREAKNFEVDGNVAKLKDAAGREVMRLTKD